MKIVIINCIPFNTGDLALLHALVAGLNKKYNQPEIVVACDRPNDISPIVPEYQWIYDYGIAQYVGKNGRLSPFLKYFRKLLQKLKIAHWFLSSGLFKTKSQKELLTHCIESDHTLLVPGGYLHDYYDIKDRIHFAQKLIKKSIKVSVLAHSLGPFWKNSSRSKVGQFLPGLHALTLREHYSSKHISQFVDPTFPVTMDLAFYLHVEYPILFKPKKDKKLLRIAVCFREWLNEAESQKIIEKAIEFLNHIQVKYSLQITFLSTCQGDSFYRNDQLVCDKIKDRLEVSSNSIKGYHSPLELIELYGSFDAYVGMRMHGAILSMLGGTPAFNIGYEDKTKGVYELLDLSELNINYNEELRDWIIKFDHFYTKYNHYLDNLKSIVEKAAQMASKNFDQLNP
jgi:polysaccharide pyruvyl transferase WcaK-like protein